MKLLTYCEFFKKICNQKINDKQYNKREKRNLYKIKQIYLKLENNRKMAVTYERKYHKLYEQIDPNFVICSHNDSAH